MRTRGISKGVWSLGKLLEGGRPGATGVCQAVKNIPDQGRGTLRDAKRKAMAFSGPRGRVAWGRGDVVAPAHVETQMLRKKHPLCPSRAVPWSDRRRLAGSPLRPQSHVPFSASLSSGRHLPRSSSFKMVTAGGFVRTPGQTRPRKLPNNGHRSTHLDGHSSQMLGPSLPRLDPPETPSFNPREDVCLDGG